MEGICINNRIGCAQKLGKQNSHKPGVTNGTLNTTSPNFHIHDKPNENIDVASEELIAANKYYRPSNNAIHTTDNFIQTKSISIPHTKLMLDTNVADDD